jgi:2-keto-3-deoxy-L-rhamnonate aldolase RhmA
LRDSLLAEMVASCRGSEIVPIARMPDAVYVLLSSALDVGPRGVMMPRVESREQAKDIVSRPKYAPLSKRGVVLGIAHDLYRTGKPDFFSKKNSEICVILLLETEKAFQHLDEIISVPAVDVAWIGQYDLTVGFPLRWTN